MASCHHLGLALPELKAKVARLRTSKKAKFDKLMRERPAICKKKYIWDKKPNILDEKGQI